MVFDYAENSITFNNIYRIILQTWIGVIYNNNIPWLSPYTKEG